MVITNQANKHRQYNNKMMKRKENKYCRIEVVSVTGAMQ